MPKPNGTAEAGWSSIGVQAAGGYPQHRHDALIEATRQMLATGGLRSLGGVKPRIVIALPAACLAQRTGARLPTGTAVTRG